MAKVDGRKFARDWMGKLVIVRAETRKRKRYMPSGKTEIFYESVSFPHRKPPIGWVVGMTYRRPGRKGFDDDYGWWYEPNGPSVPVAIVRTWPWAKPIDVPIDALELAPEGAEPEPPGGWTDAAREEVRQYAAKQPRDHRGRWTK